MTKPRLTMEERFWKYANKKGEDDCWLWIAYCGEDGYGRFGISHGHLVGAHRFSYELHYGPLPKGEYACHTCKNTSCVNPKHLFSGTNQDNQNDASKKGRLNSNRGPDHMNSKLVPDQVREIKILLRDGAEIRDIAKQFNVHCTTIRSIKSGRYWSRIVLDAG